MWNASPWYPPTIASISACDSEVVLVTPLLWQRMPDFYESLPKAELHVHLEGSVEPATLLELDGTLRPEDVRDVYKYDNFVGFLQSYAWVAKRLREPEHYGLITTRLLETLEAQNVSYAEVN